MSEPKRILCSALCASWPCLDYFLMHELVSYMNDSEGLNATHFIWVHSHPFDHNFTAWQTFEALRTLYICSTVMKMCVNDSI